MTQPVKPQMIGYYEKYTFKTASYISVYNISYDSQVPVSRGPGDGRPGFPLSCDIVENNPATQPDPSHTHTHTTAEGNTRFRHTSDQSSWVVTDEKLE